VAKLAKACPHHGIITSALPYEDESRATALSSMVHSNLAGGAAFATSWNLPDHFGEVEFSPPPQFAVRRAQRLGEMA
jgi:hypothetical protein